MKKFINNRVYDTTTSRKVGTNSYGTVHDNDWWNETLYRKPTGEYFLYGCGGAMTKYAERVYQNTWGNGENIIPLDYVGARKWSERNLSADKYKEEFGVVSWEPTMARTTCDERRV